MLEEAYHVEATAALALLGRLWFEKISHQLWNFAESLNDWLHHLDTHQSPDWRERLEAFIAEQEAAGFILSPESHADLVAYLEAWAGGLQQAEPKLSSPAVVQPEFQTVSYEPVVKSRTEEDAAPRKDAFLAHHPIQTTSAPVAHRKVRPSPYGDAPADSYQGQFNRWLAVADGYLDDIQKLLDPLGKKVADAKSDEAVEVETDVDEIASLIGAHNDAMENARKQWLEGDLGREAFDYLMLARTPASLWLPMFVNPQQAKRAQEQWKEIGLRLKERIAFLDNVIFAMEVTEFVGEAASLAIGAGIVVNAVKTGGKIALVKLVAQAAIAEGVAAATDAASQAAQDALLAAGVSQETISTIQTAATVVTFVLELKRTGAALSQRQPSSGSSRGASGSKIGVIGNSASKSQSRPSRTTRNQKPKSLPIAGRRKRRKRRHSKLRERMGTPPRHLVNPQAHHDLPQEFAKKFKAKGFDIDDPQYGRWVEGTPPGRHQLWNGEYNAIWRSFFGRFRNPSRARILKLLKELRSNPEFT